MEYAITNRVSVPQVISERKDAAHGRKAEGDAGRAATTEEVNGR
jgi:hypothetical protein